MEAAPGRNCVEAWSLSTTEESRRPTDLDGLRRIRVIEILESEIGDKDGNSEDEERERRALGEGLMCTN
jgi:hypothetical protein